MLMTLKPARLWTVVALCLALVGTMTALSAQTEARAQAGFVNSSAI